MTQFVAARDRACLSLRQLSVASGISLSVLTAMEQGSAWPRLATLQTAAGVLGLEVDVDGSPDVVAALLERLRDIPQLTLRGVAVDAGLRPNTVYDLRTPGASPSMTTILAFSYSVGADVRLASRSKEG